MNVPEEMSDTSKPVRPKVRYSLIPDDWAGRPKLGIPALPVSAEQVHELTGLVKDPPHDAGEERLLGLVTFVANGRDFDGTGFGSRWNRNRRAGGRHHAVRPETPIQAREPRASPVA